MHRCQAILIPLDFSNHVILSGAKDLRLPFKGHSLLRYGTWMS